MQRYTDVLRYDNGQAVENAEVRVYIGDSATLATLYDGAGNAISQPLTTDDSGRIINESTDPVNQIGFKAVGGRYRMTATKDEQTTTLPDILIGDAQGFDAADLIATINQGVFPSVEFALTITEDGDYFWVAAVGDALVTLYYNDEGTAVEQGSLLRGTSMQALAELTETYRDQIAAFGGYHPDTTAGLAATTDGQIFSVANDPDAGKITIYLNDDGTASAILTYIAATGTAAQEDVTAYMASLFAATDADNLWSTIMSTITKSTARTALGVDSATHPDTITPASDADVTLTSLQNSANVRVLEAGAWTQGRSLICDDEDRQFIVINNSGFSATVTTSGATPTIVVVGNGESIPLLSRAGVGISYQKKHAYGTVVQEVRGTPVTVNNSTSSTSEIASDAEVTITPMYGDSVIEVTAHVPMALALYKSGSSTANRIGELSIYNSTDAAKLVETHNGRTLVASSTVGAPSYFGIIIVGRYTVNSLSARTFQLRMRVNNPATQVFLYGTISPFYLVAKEIRS